MRSHIYATACAALLFLAGGCGKKTGGAGAAAGKGAPPGHAHVDGTPHTDDVVKAWKGAGLATDAFAQVDPGPYRAGYCSQGRVGGVDALICEYTDDDNLDRAKKMIHDDWGKEGIHTGVAVRSKRTLIAVADRASADPNGKSISKAIETFKKL
jgi:hypothetical protein